MYASSNSVSFDTSKFCKRKHANENSFLRDLSLYVDIHGLKYITERRPLYEKIFWIAFISLAIYGAANNVYRVWVTYNISETKTTISDIYHDYANIPFPSVTVCESTRVDWKKVANLNTNDVLYGGGTPEVNQQNWDGIVDDGDMASIDRDLKRLITILSMAKFGVAKDVRNINDLLRYNARMGHVNLSDLLKNIIRPCEELFINECWWRNKFYNCCDIFELQKTSYGFCYGFNSDISEDSKLLSSNYGLNGSKNNRWIDWNQQARPRRAAGHGVWTGLRINLKLQDIPRHLDVKPGVIVIVGDPSGFPSENDLFIPANKYGSVDVWGDALVTSERLKKIPPHKRRCLYPDEARILNRGYLRQNCLADCFRQFLEDNCQCGLDLVYYRIANDSTYKPCKVDNLRCLAEYNYNFGSQIITENVASNEMERTRSLCDCPDDCQNQKYIANAIIEGSASGDTRGENEITVDVHFRTSFCTLYRTDIVFDFIDSIVYYGSIAGLFLGTSLLSFGQIIFLIISGLYRHITIRHRRSVRSSIIISPTESTSRGDSFSLQSQNDRHSDSLCSVDGTDDRGFYFKNDVSRSCINKIFDQTV